MSLTRKLLKGMGLAEDQADTIMDAYEDTLKEIKAERDKYKAESEKVADVQKELDELKESAKDDSKNPWKGKYDELKNEYEKYKSDEAAKATRRTKEDAYRALLQECGVADKRIGSVLKVTDINALELEEDGKIKDLAKVKANIKSEWGDFISSEGKKGAETATPPANNGGKRSREDILAIKDTAERQQAMLDNKELFL